ncbi:Sau3AI family type II restriction endonuclease [Olsenella massiliensis]|uniref:Sau3AI family type II restriction endonuclease n=1 Tax=Olsenella massiliensis TaxID=1622075 RepID=UPI00071C4B66|nr:Sau3AI family type II restriction endonuclease [Olsenella massiliensis]
MSAGELPYDDADAASILRYAQRLPGTTLRMHVDAETIVPPVSRRGSLGNFVEEKYFLYAPNSDPRPDFPKVGIELKTTPMKRLKDQSLSAKERLVISMIDYHSVVNEDFEHSHFLDKARNILLLAYLYEKEKDPLDFEFVLADLWGIPEDDLPQIKRDWETVVGKVREGRAEDISGSDTLYLEACTKATNSRKRTTQPFSAIPAKPRAWALKASYMTAVENALLSRRQRIKRVAGEAQIDLLQVVRARFQPYFGMTEDALFRHFGLCEKRGHKAKNACALVTKRILGIDDDAKIEEFEKAGIKPKTMRVKTTGVPKEDVSFPAFDYGELEATNFESSEFYQQLQQRYLFVMYRQTSRASETYVLSDVAFWQMPDDDLDEARRCYEHMRDNVRRGRAEDSVHSSENRCCHVRPHGRRASDVVPQPHGRPVTKKSFWLNKKYLAEELKKL